MKKIPYGQSNFQALIMDGYAYIDKTRFIEVIENTGLKFIAFLRPRRFGKSLFLSMLDHYYDLDNRETFDALFGALYIGQNPTSNRNAYYMLNFNFSGIDTQTEAILYTAFRQRIKTSLDHFCQRYHVRFDLVLEPNTTPATILDAFFSQVSTQLAGKIYVLIDEYDHFANELLSFQPDVFSESISQNGVVRKWYEILKDATKTVVDRIFITGVSPVTLDSLTSGFNISKNLSLRANLHEMMGFTDLEVADLVRESGSPIPFEELLPTFRCYYNGYQFSRQAVRRLFNSDMVLHYLSELIQTGNPPEDLIDINIASDYGKIEKLLNLNNKRRENIVVIDEILDGNPTVPFKLTEMFAMERPFTRNDFRSLLFYMGFLSIRSSQSNLVTLAVPNYVIQELYYDFFMAIVKKEAESSDFYFDLDRLQSAVSDIAFEGKIDGLLTLVEDTLSHLSNRDFIQLDEKHIKMVMLSYLVMGRLFYVKSETEANRGYVDIALLKRSGVDINCQAILELKYIKSSELTDSRLETAIAEGKLQLARYAEEESLKAIPELKKWLLVMAGTKWVFVKEI